MACNKELLGNFVKSCEYFPTTGIENLYLINYKDIDRSATQIDANGVISTMVLKMGKKIFKLEGNDKTGSIQSNTVKRDFYTGFEHVVNYKILNLNEQARENLSAFVNGARVVAIAEKTDAGADGESRFEVVGYHVGLKESGEFKWSSNENSGAGDLTLKTDEKSAEPYHVRLFKINGGSADVETWIEANLMA